MMGMRTEGWTRRRFLALAVQAGVFAGLLGSGAYGLVALSRGYARDRLVAPRELLALLGEEGVKVLDARPPLRYRRGHLPGAANVWDLDLHTWEEVPRKLAPLPQLIAALERAGVSRQKTVVVYDDGEGVWAARLLWVLDYLGHPDVRLLDGGLPAWEAQGGELVTDPPAIEPTTFEPQTRPEVLIGFEELRAALEAGDDSESLVLVDARTRPEYEGGHLPGARLLPPEGLLRADGRFRRAHLLSLRAGEAGVSPPPSRDVVIYSETGLRASLVYVALTLLGLSPRVYDGGLAEWKRRGGPLERSPLAGQEEHRSTCW